MVQNHKISPNIFERNILNSHIISKNNNIIHSNSMSGAKGLPMLTNSDKYSKPRNGIVSEMDKAQKADQKQQSDLAANDLQFSQNTQEWENWVTSLFYSYDKDHDYRLIASDLLPLLQDNGCPDISYKSVIKYIKDFQFDAPNNQMKLYGFMKLAKKLNLQPPSDPNAPRPGDMVVQKFVQKLAAECCYVVFDPVSKEGCIIDPGGEDQAVVDFCRANKLKVKNILVTHCHPDHTLGCGFMKRAFPSAPVMVHQDDLPGWCENRDRIAPMLSKFNVPLPKYPLDTADQTYLDEVQPKFTYGGQDLIVFHTPGHTPGSVCLMRPSQKIVFTGDVLTAQGWGSTDHWGGDEAMFAQTKQMMIKQLRGYHVYPGHKQECEFDDAIKAVKEQTVDMEARRAEHAEAQAAAAEIQNRANGAKQASKAVPMGKNASYEQKGINQDSKSKSDDQVLQDLFVAFDSDSDGKLTADNLVNLLQNSGYPSADYKMGARLMKEYQDSAQFGYMNLQGFKRLAKNMDLAKRVAQMQVVKAPVKQQYKALDPVPKSRFQLLCALFNRYDTDNDGRLKFNDLKSLLTENGFQRITDRQIRQLLLQYQDINYDEYHSMTSDDIYIGSARFGKLADQLGIQV